MKHTMNLNPSPFNLIKEGKKTIELRLYDEKRRLICAGDEIEFINARDRLQTLNTRVKAVHRFDSFAELYQSLPLLSCGYTPEDVGSASPEDMNEYYSPERQAKYGVVGIEIELKE